MDDSWISLVRAPRRQLVEDLALVLAAEGVPYEVHGRSDWSLRVPFRRYGDAAAALAAYESEHRNPDLAFSEPDDQQPSQIGIAVALTLLAFHLALAISGAEPEWLKHGRVSYNRIADGELWRCVTALSLHSGPFHVASNAVAIALFGNFLGRALGPGAAVWVMLLSGSIGNGLNVLWRAAPHLSIGASTAVFGTVGALAGLQAQRYRDRPAMSARAWVPLAGAVALLAMLGSSPESDFVAHVTGLVAGTAIGLLIDRQGPRRLSLRGQWLLVLSAAAMMVSSWGIALGAS